MMGLKTRAPLPQPCIRPLRLYKQRPLLAPDRALSMFGNTAFTILLDRLKQHELDDKEHFAEVNQRLDTFEKRIEERHAENMRAARNQLVAIVMILLSMLGYIGTQINFARLFEPHQKSHIIQDDDPPQKPVPHK